MDHEDAVRTQAVEKYFLGQLAEPDRDAFEAHYFECAICAAEVTAGVVFADNAAAEWKSSAPKRAVERAAQKKSWIGSLGLQAIWHQPAFALSLAALVAVSALWTADHRHLEGELSQVSAPQLVETIRPDEALKGAPQPVEHAGRSTSVPFFIDDTSRAAYSIEISGGGMSPVTLQTPKRPRYEVLFRNAGTYHIVVRGAGTKDIVKEFDVTVP